MTALYKLARRRHEEFRLFEERKLREEMMLRDEEAMVRSRTKAARDRLESSRARLEDLRKRVLQLEDAQAFYQAKLDRPAGEDYESLEKHSDYMDLRRQSGAIEAELAQARDELSVKAREYSKYQRELADLQQLIEQRFARGRG